MITPYFSEIWCSVAKSKIRNFRIYDVILDFTTYFRNRKKNCRVVWNVVVVVVVLCTEVNCWLLNPIEYISS